MAFIVKNNELSQASQDYATAASNYSLHSDQLIKAMNIDSSSWSDEAGNKWSDIVQKAGLEFPKVKSNLDSNSKLLSEIAKKAAETEDHVSTGIGNIYSE